MSFILTVTEPDGGVALRVTGACACFSTPESAVEPVEAPLIQGRPVLGHVVLENRARCKGSVVFLERGRCPFSTKLLHANHAGARAVIIGNYSEARGRQRSGTLAMTSSSDYSFRPEHPPCLFISTEHAERLKAIMERFSLPEAPPVRAAIVCVSAENVHALEMHELGCALRGAAIFNQVELLKAILKRCRDNPAVLNETDIERKCTAVHLAAEYGNVECLRELVKHDIDTEKRRMDGYVPLHTAAEMRFPHLALEMCDVLTEGLVPRKSAQGQSTTNSYQSTPTLHSAGTGLSAGLSLDDGPTMTTGTTTTTTHPASLTTLSSSPELVDTNAEATANADRPWTCSWIDNPHYPLGWTSLHFASKRGHISLISLLVRRGANMYAQAEDGNTPLHIAASFNQYDALNTLIDALHGSTDHHALNLESLDGPPGANGSTPPSMAGSNGGRQQPRGAGGRGGGLKQRSTSEEHQRSCAYILTLANNKGMTVLRLLETATPPKTFANVRQEAERKRFNALARVQRLLASFRARTGVNAASGAGKGRGGAGEGLSLMASLTSPDVSFIESSSMFISSLMAESPLLMARFPFSSPKNDYSLDVVKTILFVSSGGATGTALNEVMRLPIEEYKRSLQSYGAGLQLSQYQQPDLAKVVFSDVGDHDDSDGDEVDTAGGSGRDSGGGGGAGSSSNGGGGGSGDMGSGNNNNHDESASNRGAVSIGGGGGGSSGGGGAPTRRWFYISRITFWEWAVSDEPSRSGSGENDDAETDQRLGEATSELEAMQMQTVELSSPPSPSVATGNAMAVPQDHDDKRIELLDLDLPRNRFASYSDPSNERYWRVRSIIVDWLQADRRRTYWQGLTSLATPVAAVCSGDQAVDRGRSNNRERDADDSLLAKGDSLAEAVLESIRGSSSNSTSDGNEDDAGLDAIGHVEYDHDRALRLFTRICANMLSKVPISTSRGVGGSASRHSPNASPRMAGRELPVASYDPRRLAHQLVTLEQFLWFLDPPFARAMANLSVEMEYFAVPGVISYLADMSVCTLECVISFWDVMLAMPPIFSVCVHVAILQYVLREQFIALARSQASTGEEMASHALVLLSRMNNDHAGSAASFSGIGSSVVGAGVSPMSLAGVASSSSSSSSSSGLLPSSASRRVESVTDVTAVLDGALRHWDAIATAGLHVLERILEPAPHRVIPQVAVEAFCKRVKALPLPGPPPSGHTTANAPSSSSIAPQRSMVLVIIEAPTTSIVDSPFEVEVLSRCEVIRVPWMSIKGQIAAMQTEEFLSIHTKLSHINLLPLSLRPLQFLQFMSAKNTAIFVYGPSALDVVSMLQLCQVPGAVALC